MSGYGSCCAEVELSVGAGRLQRGKGSGQQHAIITLRPAYRGSAELSAPMLRDESRHDANDCGNPIANELAAMCHLRRPVEGPASPMRCVEMPAGS